jgi:high affinity Mn2+ porin
MTTSSATTRRRVIGPLPAVLLCLSAGALVPGAAAAAQSAETDPMTDSPFMVRGQMTYTEQETGAFNAPYAGPNSLSPAQGRETVDLTLDLGLRLWHGAELWFDPELDQGFGLDDTLGLAGFASGEAYKVGRKVPYLRLQRAFVRQSIDLGGERESVEAAANQFAETHLHDRVVITLGKFGVGDIFDVNQYAHDPRGDFLNWSVIDGGAFDYAADAWGYTAGAAIEWYRADWTLRGGLVDLSDIPNSPHLDPGFHEFQLLAELEHRHVLNERSGKMLVTVYDSRGRMGLLSDAIAAAALTGSTPDVTTVRHYRSRSGISLNVEQQLADDLGAFLRASGAGGNVEVYEFTDIDRSIATGFALKGARWGRGDDTVGCAGVVNGISALRQRYLALGGLGILVGDGRLPHPAPERILETYYKLGVFRQLHVTFDYQRVENPAYNRERGPVSIVALRLHGEF